MNPIMPAVTQAAGVDSASLMLYDNHKKSAPVAYLLLIFLGGLGAHRLYLRQTAGTMWLLAWIVSIVAMFGGAPTLSIVIWALAGFVMLIDLFLIPGMVRAYNSTIIERLTRAG